MRNVVAGCILALVTAGASGAQRRELTAHEQAVHVASRLTFGAKPGDVDRIIALGVDRWIERQLRPASIEDIMVNGPLGTLPMWTVPVAELPGVPPFSQMTGTTLRYTDSAGAPLSGDDTLRAASITIAMRGAVSMSNGQLVPRNVGGARMAHAFQLGTGKVIRAQMSERQLEEVLADFWENHFSVSSQKIPGPGVQPAFVRGAIRPLALGKFRDVLGAVAHHAAMLFYLDNHTSTAKGLNENYARELLELHTLGVDGGYTQDDVVNVARALTGWSFDPPARAIPFFVTGERFQFRAEAHDSSEKAVLGVRLPPGRGVEDGEQVLDILARHPSTAAFISRKLVRRLVSDSVPESLVQRAAATFTRTDGDITEVVRTIVTSDEFFSRAAFRAKVKSPFELVVSTRRAMNATPDTTDGSYRQLTAFGQTPYGRLSPDGWPDYAKAWMTAGAMHQRFTFAAEVARGQMKHLTTSLWDGWRFADEPAAKQVDAVIKLVLGGIAEAETRGSLQRTSREAFEAVPGETVGTTRLRELLAIALASPDFQRR